MANSKVRCIGCRGYVYRSDARRLGRLGWSCSELCDLNIRERQNQRRQVRRLKGEISELSTQKKARIRQRDGGRCRWCGSRSNLQVHHILYRSQGGPDEEWNLITLCEACHRRAHSDKRRYQPLLLATSWKHYVEGQKQISVATTARHLRARDEAPAV